MNNDTSTFNVPMTYSGLLDDVVLRHRITPEVDMSFFNRSIIKNVFFSGRIFLNDGYLVNHPAALAQLTNENSVLRTMLKQNFVRVIARQPDADQFAKNPEMMAERGVKSFQQLVDRVDWPDIRRRLYNWANGFFNAGMIDPWPPVLMHHGFRKLFDRIFDKDLDDLGLTPLSGFDIDDFRRQYEEHPSHENAPRTAVEEVAEAMKEAGKLDRLGVALLMNIANQCYHYNFAMCLSDSTGKQVVTDTTIGKAFEDILDLDQAVEAEIEKLPVLSVPKNFPIDNGALFDVLLDHGSDLNTAKHDFLYGIEQLFKNPTNRSARELADDVNEASEKYRRYLEDHFQNRIGPADFLPRSSSIITFGLGKASGAVGGDNVMLVANLASSGRLSSFVQRMTRPISRRLLEVAFDPNAEQRGQITFRVGDVRPRFTSLAFNNEAIASHVSDIPRFE